MDIHQALNWRAIWPVLRNLPKEKHLRVLDAGCGEGAWCRRLARRRPRWQVVGMDRDAERLGAARRRQGRRPLRNVSFEEGDFLSGIRGQYDVIYSIFSIHYAATEGRGVEVLRNLQEALNAGGTLILLVPRTEQEHPAWSRLPRPTGWPVFEPDVIDAMLEQAGLQTREIRGLYGRWCMLGKQISMWSGGSVIKRAATAPLQALVRILSFDLVMDPGRRSYALRVVANI